MSIGVFPKHKMKRLLPEMACFGHNPNEVLFTEDERNKDKKHVFKACI